MHIRHTEKAYLGSNVTSHILSSSTRSSYSSTFSGSPVPEREGGETRRERINGSWVRTHRGARTSSRTLDSGHRLHAHTNASAQCEEPNWPVARPVARPCIKAGESLQSPRPTQLIFVGTHFPLCYESTAESGPDNWISWHTGRAQRRAS
jgi:hypothetical protein